ncbi:MAG: DUF6797 domain-containing protein [Rhodothermales bacterium]
MHRFFAAAVLACFMSIPGVQAQQTASSPPPGSPYASFVEDDFPFITTALRAGELSDVTPDDNWSVRGIVVQLGHDTYLCFDPDLLRMAVAWQGEFVSLMTMAQVSYHQLDKGNANPRVLGEPLAATGMYAGWMADPRFEDPRPPGDYPADPGRGPLPASMGAYEGLYVHGNDVVFSYRVGRAHVDEQPGLIRGDVQSLVTRTFRMSRSDEPLNLVTADVDGASVLVESPDEVVIAHGDGNVTAVFLEDAAGRPAGSSAIRSESSGGGLFVRSDRYVLLRVPAADGERRFRVAMWSGPRDALEAARALNETSVRMVEDVREGGPGRWPEVVATGVEVAPDTNAFVYDHIALPDPNPWRRNVRPADLAFLSDGRAAVVTFDGDVWMARGLASESPVWRRFASGLYEPLAVEVVADDVYVYGREGIVRLHDVNGDGEADFYEAFAPGIIQSTASREWPFDLVARPEGGFYVTQGGALSSPAEPDRTPLLPGFLEGSPHNGAVLEVSPDGREVARYATGFRAPYIGVHPESGRLTASDQQGNFVPSTPLYVVERDGYYGVAATAHRPDPLPQAPPPLTWIPHRVDPSGTSQVWMTSDGNGPLDGGLVHLSYGRSGLFRVYVDSLANPVQGAVTPLPDDRLSPTLKAALHPVDGRLYVAGFQVWGSTAEKLASLRRLRYTGREHGLPEHVRAGKQGVLITFDKAVQSPRPDDVTVTRYNYLRSERYGSGHYRLDGSEGEETLPVAAAHVSDDGRNVLLVLPDMREVMQMTVDYRLVDLGGTPVEGQVYLTVNDASGIDLSPYGLAGVDWEADLVGVSDEFDSEEGEEIEASAVRGRHLYHETGCVACHSSDGTQGGRLGPTFDGLYGSERELASGEVVGVDDGYLRRAVLDPGDEVAVGFEGEMPSFRGILGDSDIESIILFIKTLTASD